MTTLGVPYAKGYDLQANADLIAQAKKIQTGLKAEKLEAGANTEILALIAYLQRVGTDIKNAPKPTVAALTN
jgi:cytochrome c oxidase cbb3-type subunit I/II